MASVLPFSSPPVLSLFLSLSLVHPPSSQSHHGRACQTPAPPSGITQLPDSRRRHAPLHTDQPLNAAKAAVSLGVAAGLEVEARFRHALDLLDHFELFAHGHRDGGADRRHVIDVIHVILRLPGR
ncbi:uncharacterized protein J3D65DRAFT_620623 [Phyllosticta citribraziliensis]|uniref:Uncharacterized protein n=1 Tax=Phyllosticta citribraziliensis TaxID=989973 RepID=A0ABR1LXY9_9PEZI